MIFYHGTSRENWGLIQKEGLLWGRRFVTNNKGKIIEEDVRCTYLAAELEGAQCYGDIILEVEYDPSEHPKLNDFHFGCWQVRVYEPIAINKVKRL